MRLMMCGCSRNLGLADVFSYIPRKWKNLQILKPKVMSETQVLIHPMRVRSAAMRLRISASRVLHSARSSAARRRRIAVLPAGERMQASIGNYTGRASWESSP